MRRSFVLVAGLLVGVFVAGCGSADPAGAAPPQAAANPPAGGSKGPHPAAAPGMMGRPPGGGTPNEAGQKLGG